MTTSRGSLTALVLALGALCVFVGVSVDAAEPRLAKVRIVHTNDLHGHLENAAAIAAFVRAERKSSDAVLVLDAGDGITGTPVSTLYRGVPIFEVMSRMGYDAGTLGNHEFDHGSGAIATFRDAADFPLLCANADGPDGLPLADAASHVFQVGSLKIGVLGLVTDRVPSMTVGAATVGCRFEAPLEAARRLVPELRKRCDLLVLLTHVGVEVDAALAAAIPGVDVVIGGHTHTKLDRPLAVKGPDRTATVAHRRWGADRARPARRRQ
jgi:2',3'-cyclic-nucleotide 2'-phosphodiesterase (5'-nucleotidase family)